VPCIATKDDAESEDAVKLYFYRSMLIVAAGILFSCGDPFFLSYQIKKNTTSNLFPPDAKSINGVTIIVTPDSYQMMYSVYSSFMVEIYNNAEKNITIEPGRITLKYDGGAAGIMRPKKKYQTFEIEPGEMCDMKISFEDPYNESRDKKGYSRTLEIPVVLYDGQKQRTEVFLFNSVSSSAGENLKR
jgi:hypothetical protein